MVTVSIIFNDFCLSFFCKLCKFECAILQRFSWNTYTNTVCPWTTPTHSLPLNNRAHIFFNSKYHSTTQSMVDSVSDTEKLDTECPLWIYTWMLTLWRVGAPPIYVVQVSSVFQIEVIRYNHRGNNVSIFSSNSKLRFLTTKFNLFRMMNIGLGREATDNLIQETSPIHSK